MYLLAQTIGEIQHFKLFESPLLRAIAAFVVESDYKAEDKHAYSDIFKPISLADVVLHGKSGSLCNV